MFPSLEVRNKLARAVGCCGRGHAEHTRAVAHGFCDHLFDGHLRVGEDAERKTKPAVLAADRAIGIRGVKALIEGHAAALAAMWRVVHTFIV